MQGRQIKQCGLFSLTLLATFLHCSCLPHSTGGKPFPETAKEIASYTKVAKSIIDLAVYGNAQNRSYERLADFTDTIGNRVSGSKNLDLAIKYMFSALRKDGLENVHLEPVKIPHWVRGEESAMMLQPRNHTMAILGLGSSVATPQGGRPMGNSMVMKLRSIFFT